MKRCRFANYGTVAAITLAATAMLTSCEPADLRAPETRVDWTAAMGLASLASLPAADVEATVSSPPSRVDARDAGAR